MRLQAWTEGLWDSEDGIPASENEWGLPRFTPIRTHIHLKKLWAKALLPIGRVSMAKKKEVLVERWGRCGTCMERFDRVEAAKCAKEGRALIHQCGRVLVRAR